MNLNLSRKLPERMSPTSSVVLFYKHLESWFLLFVFSDRLSPFAFQLVKKHNFLPAEGMLYSMDLFHFTLFLKLNQVMRELENVCSFTILSQNFHTNVKKLIFKICLIFWIDNTFTSIKITRYKKVLEWNRKWLLHTGSKRICTGSMATVQTRVSASGQPVLLLLDSAQFYTVSITAASQQHEPRELIQHTCIREYRPFLWLLIRKTYLVD